MWLGAMGYSLFLVQPRLARMVGNDPGRLEEIHSELAHGNRRPVLALLAVIWLTGIAHAVLRPGNPLGASVEALALAGASALFWWVSWRGWPQRLFALPEELPELQRRFRRVALTMFGLAAAATIAAVLSVNS